MEFGNCLCRKSAMNRVSDKHFDPQKQGSSKDRNVSFFNLSDRRIQFLAVFDDCIFQFCCCFQNCWKL